MHPPPSEGTHAQPWSAPPSVWRLAQKDLREPILKELHTKIMTKNLYPNV